MEGKELDKITAFDTLFTTNHIQKCKVLLSYLPPSFQKTLAVYIKLSELQYTLSFFNRHPHASLCVSSHALQQPFSHSDAEGFSQLFDDMSPYLSPEEQGRFSQMKNMMQSMKNLQEMMEMMEMMKSLFPEGMGNSEEGGPINSDFLSALSGMSGMDFDPSMLSQAMQMMNPRANANETASETKNKDN